MIYLIYFSSYFTFTLFYKYDFFLLLKLLLHLLYNMFILYYPVTMLCSWVDDKMYELFNLLLIPGADDH